MPVRLARLALVVSLVLVALAGRPAAAQPRFVFDYSLDSNNFFGAAGSVQRQTLDAAAARLTSRLGDTLTAISPGGANTYSAGFTNPGTGAGTVVSNLPVAQNAIVVYAGGRSQTGTQIAYGEYGSYSYPGGTTAGFPLALVRGQAGALSAPATAFGRWSGAVTFDTRPDTAWHFGLDAPVAGKYDFLSVAEHELAHVLGFGAAPSWTRYAAGGVFTGPNATAANGGERRRQPVAHRRRGPLGRGDDLRRAEGVDDPDVLLRPADGVHRTRLRGPGRHRLAGHAGPGTGRRRGGVGFGAGRAATRPPAGAARPDRGRDRPLLSLRPTAPPVPPDCCSSRAEPGIAADGGGVTVPINRMPLATPATARLGRSGGLRVGKAFVDRWKCKEATFGFADFGTEFVSCGAVALPPTAAPCLTFDHAVQPVPVWQVFGGPSDWSVSDRERLAPYRVIGSDGAGNPLCVEQGSGAVILLDHEDRFRTRQFVNSGVGQLAECLLAYLGESQPGRFRTAVSGIDPPALAMLSFWWQEAAGLDTHAEPGSAATVGG